LAQDLPRETSNKSSCIYIQVWQVTGLTSLPRIRRIYFLVILVLILMFYLWNLVRVRLVDIEWLKEDRISRTMATSGWLIKEEQLLLSPGRGQLRLLVDDGERVRAGAPVAEVILSQNGGAGEKRVVYAPRGGVFCNHIDGLEEVLRPANALKMEAVEKLEVKPVSPVTGSRVEKGEPVGKLVDNLSGIWYWCRVDGEGNRAVKWPAGQQVVILWQGRPVEARLEKIAGEEMLFLLPAYPGDLIHRRQVQMELKVGELSGYAVPSRALVKRGEEQGIYIVSRRRVAWVPVRVLGGTPERVIITGEQLSACTRYVANPFWVREGDELE
jgi:putative membrane fusion protein